MEKLLQTIAAHPLRHGPYNAIKFVRLNHHGKPLYRVGKSAKELGAAAALRAAFKEHGAQCFHCNKIMEPQALSYDCTRDHVRPKKDGGREYLHNLVIACGSCNRSKGASDIVTFRPKAGRKFLRALDAHLVHCLEQLNNKPNDTGRGDAK